MVQFKNRRRGGQRHDPICAVPAFLHDAGRLVGRHGDAAGPSCDAGTRPGYDGAQPAPWYLGGADPRHGQNRDLQECRPDPQLPEHGSGRTAFGQQGDLAAAVIGGDVR